MWGQVLAAAIGTISFSLIFHVHKRYYLACGIIGGLGWLVYLVSCKYFSIAESSFFATSVVALCSRTCAVYKKCPVTIFLIAGIFPLVPGAGIYWTAYYLVTSQNALCMSSGILTIKTAFAIVLGIVFVFELPQNFFQKILFFHRERTPYERR